MTLSTARGVMIGAGLLLITLSSGGCTKTYRKQFARYEPGAPKLMMTVPATAVYKVKWTPDKKKHLETIAGMEVLLHKGDEAGFATREDGTVVAVAGAYEVILDRMPEDASYCLWYHKSKRQTQFGKEVDKALDTTGKVIVTGALVGGAAALIGTAAYLEAQNDGYCHKHHRYHCGSCW